MQPSPRTLYIVWVLVFGWVLVAATVSDQWQGAFVFGAPFAAGLLAGTSRVLDEGFFVCAFLANCAVAAGLATYEVFLSGDLLVEAPLRAPIQGFPRAAAYTGSTFSAAYLFAASLPLSLALIVPPSTSPWRRIVGIATTSLLLVGLLATWTLGAWIVALAGVVYSAAVGLQPFNSRRLLVLLSAVPALALLYVATEVPALSIVELRAERLSTEIAGDTVRSRLWSQAASEAWENPFLGRGLEYWSPGAPRIHPSDSPESWYLLVAREAGLLPAFVYVVLLARLCWRAFREPTSMTVGALLLGIAGSWVMTLSAPILHFLFVGAACAPISNLATSSMRPGSRERGPWGRPYGHSQHRVVGS